MEVQVGKMILYGILTSILYIAAPLILFEILEARNVMTFSQGFKISIIIFGIIGVIISMLRHLFPKDSSANRWVAFGATLYSGIYLFYMFGGFTPGVALGTYSITLPTIQVLLGLQLIAWLLLGSSGIRALQYMVEAIELRKKKEYSVTVRKQFKLSTLFKIFGTLMGLGIAGYFGSLVYSGANLGFGNYSYDLTRDPGALPDPNFTDDTINLTFSFDVSNQGIYAIYDVTVDLALYTLTTGNPIALPENEKIGESLNNDLGTFHSFTTTQDNNVTLTLDPTYNVGFATTTATLQFQISFSTVYAGIFIELNLTIESFWPGIV